MQCAGVNDICKDIESLKKLISNAGLAATHPGPLLSPNRTTVHFTLSSRERSSTVTKSELSLVVTLVCTHSSLYIGSFISTWQQYTNHAALY